MKDAGVVDVEGAAIELRLDLLRVEDNERASAFLPVNLFDKVPIGDSVVSLGLDQIDHLVEKLKIFIAFAEVIKRLKGSTKSFGFISDLMQTTFCIPAREDFDQLFGKFYRAIPLAYIGHRKQVGYPQVDWYDRPKITPRPATVQTRFARRLSATDFQVFEPYIGLFRTPEMSHFPVCVELVKVARCPVVHDQRLPSLVDYLGLRPVWPIVAEPPLEERTLSAHLLVQASSLCHLVGGLSSCV